MPDDRKGAARAAPVPVLVSPVNISEGRRPAVIARIADAAELPGVHVLDIHSDPDHHRSVLTIAGGAGALVDGLLAATRTAAELIDLRHHDGVHPRFGAVDVVPFVAMAEADRTVAVASALRFAEAVAERLGIPCFLYEAAGGPPLPAVRRHAFSDRLPDRFPAGSGPSPHPSAGAVAVGVRGLLVAYNVDLATDDVAVARSIAAGMRERNSGLAGVRALGVPLPSRNATQISMNLTQPLVTTVGMAFNAVARLATASGIRVLDSELVGLAPRGALPRDPDPLLLLRPAKVLEEELDRYFPTDPTGRWVVPAPPG